LTKADLDQFYGTENYYKHPFSKTITYTDGVQFVAERAGAYWLLDKIILAQKFQPLVAAEEFQVWKLVVAEDSAVLTCDDGNGNIVYTKQIEYTDFPLDEIEIWLTNDVMLLPSEN
jgi:hypothetical protein